MAYRYECPVNDWFCPQFDNGECQLRDAPQECDAFFGIEDDEPDDIDLDMGFDPYLGCYTDDC